MMEVSKSLQTDIRNIQNQLRIAIQNHQVLVVKMRADPANLQMKKQLVGVQKHILLLGEKQKRLVQQLRKEVEANSTNSNLTVKSLAQSLGFNNNTVKYMPIRPSSVSSTSSSTTSEDSEDSQRERDEVVAKCCRSANCDPTLATKLQFMNAVGLVTREVLSELQNRRVERKRRSTANHTQFVYGNSWEVSKRKKSSYLPTPPRRSLRVEPSGENTETLRIPGLPASLTIERIKAQVCMVCRKPGTQLSTCSRCSVDYHEACAAQCPQCEERLAEKQRLVTVNVKLKSELDSLEQRKDSTAVTLAEQAVVKKALLEEGETTTKKIEQLRDFVTRFQARPSS